MYSRDAHSTELKIKKFGSKTHIWLEIYILESIYVHSIENLAFEKFWAIIRVLFYHRIFSDM